MRRVLFVICLALGLIQCATPPTPALDPSNPICLGSETAESYLIFLRGMDKTGSEAGEKSLRQLFTRLATEFNMRVALPRARLPCTGDRSFRCWGWDFGTNELNVSGKTIQDAAATCFPQNVPFVLVGFSNGGFLLSKLYRRCQLQTYIPQARFAVVIGATALRSPIRDVAQDLRNCGRLRILSGTHDTLNANLDGSYVRLLQSHGGDVEEVLFEGGHSLPEAELRELLRTNK